MPISEHDTRLLKLATRRLVERAGHAGQAAELLGRQAPQVSKWMGAAYPETMPIGEVLALEQAVGAPLVTEQLAACHGRKLSAEGEAPVGAGVIAAHAALAREFAEVMASVAHAIADGSVTVTDMNAIFADAQDLADAVRALKGAVAQAASSGGSVIGLHAKR